MSSLSSKSIAIVGGGSVGTTLASSLVTSAKAKSVVIAARDPEKTMSTLAEKGLSHIPVKSMATAIAESDILILATTSKHSDEEIKSIADSLGDVTGKVVIDATNPLSSFPNGLEVRWAQGVSGGEKLQEYLPGAKVYKAFNTLGVEHMTTAKATGTDMFFCGPDSESAYEVVAAVGYRPIYVGPIRYARNIEALAELWIHCAIPPLPANYLGRDWTFSVTGPTALDK